MDFQTFCSTWFKGSEEKAIRQLIWEEESEEFRRTGSQEGLQAILATMTREQTELYRQMAAQREAVRQKESKHFTRGGIVIMVMLLGIMILMLANGWNNLAVRRELRETGIPVTVTVTDKVLDSSGDIDVYYYTFTYTVEGTTYTVVDSSDHGHDVGDTLQEYVDPQHPEKLVLVSDSLPIFFMLGGPVLGWLAWMTEKKLRRYLLLALAGLWVLMAAIGLMYDAYAYTVIGCILLALMLLIWLIVWLRKKQRA